MRKDVILDLGLYFVKHSNKALTKENLHDFIVLADILELEKYATCFSDADYILKNNRIEVVGLDDLVSNNTDFRRVFVESENAYDTFSVATQALVEQAMLVFNGDEKTLRDKLYLSIPVEEGIIFSDELYRVVLGKSYGDSDVIDEIIEKINHHKYMYKTFAL